MAKEVHERKSKHDECLQPDVVEDELKLRRHIDDLSICLLRSLDAVVSLICTILIDCNARDISLNAEPVVDKVETD